MPNVGKPSKGCKNCRDRKVKCDQKRPSCTQCVRISKECFGYRDPLSMMFKNESEVVARRAKIRYAELTKKSNQATTAAAAAAAVESSPKPYHLDPNSPSSGSDSESSAEQLALKTWLASQTRFVKKGIAPSLEDQAIGFFFSNYVQKPTFVPRGEFDFLSEMLDHPETKKIVHSSVAAAGLASLATSTKSPAVMKRAQEEYVKALSMTNKALQSTETALKDGTLVSVIMLGLYENFAFQSKGSLASWAKHVRGACTLLSMRGVDQLKHSLGRRIFQQFYGTVLLVALETRTPIPQDLCDIWETTTDMRDYSSFGKLWTTEMVRLIRRAIDLSQDNKSSPLTILAAASQLDTELQSLMAWIPNIWRYETKALRWPVDYVYGETYHIYTDPWILQMWNNLRACRLVLHGIILSSITKDANTNTTLDAEPVPVLSESQAHTQSSISKHIITTTVAEVCASAPQILGQIPFPDMESLSSQSDADLPTFNFHPYPPGTFSNSSKTTYPHHLIWPLYAIGDSPLCPPDLREWCIRVLYYIALKIGTRQAVVLADDLKSSGLRGKTTEVGDGELHPVRTLRDMHGMEE
ncbi:hypothetical protein B0J11DRAFT_577408 [Dendryphion nanum]|uniref:Zn(2)-C6 fungal-type domain-containing protein n=1 Tax=Dendryphion nanum TaxID=256645 RepID=A0A9P9E5W0_9PLEO|nr:hypothetical protein B0J11DRAFT_577408 [Dendryphion nanum]